MGPRSWWWIAALALLWAASPLAAGELPPADGDALWRHISQPPGFTTWGSWSDLRLMRRSHCATAYGYFSRVYANDIALRSPKVPLEPGSILVREGQGMGTNTYAPNGQIVSYTVMYKVKGYNRRDNDWFWVSYTGTGRVVDSGRLIECIKCHRNAWQSDYIQGHDFK